MLVNITESKLECRIEKDGDPAAYRINQVNNKIKKKNYFWGVKKLNVMQKNKRKWVLTQNQIFAADGVFDLIF